MNPVPPRSRFTVCGIVKNEGKYLLEWLAYHRVVGAEHFFIYDNESDDGSSDMLVRLAARGILTHIPWPSQPGKSPQLPAYQAALERFRHRTNWLAIIDADEFIVPLVDNDIPTVLRDFEAESALAVNWRIFGSAGQQQHGQGMLMERFQMAAARHHGVNRHVKTILRPERTKEIGIHSSTFIAGHCVNELHEPVTGPLTERASWTRLQINHYFCKSREEWLVKRARGRASLAEGAAEKIRPDEQFYNHDLNDERDVAILRFYEATRAEMQTLYEISRS